MACRTAKAALGSFQRTGLGEVRNLRAQALWLQEVSQEGRASCHKIAGEVNPADAGIT